MSEKNVFNPSVNTSFNGIITHINSKYPNGFKKYINIDPCSSANDHLRDGAYPIINRSSYKDEIYERRSWCSGRQEYPNFTVSFTGFVIIPTYYSLKARADEDGFYPMSWEIEGSLDNNRWEKIGEEDSGTTLEEGNSQTYAFTQMKTYKYIKFVQTKGHNGDTICCLQQIEFFGKIHNKILSFCNRKVILQSTTMFVIIIMNKR